MSNKTKIIIGVLIGVVLTLAVYGGVNMLRNSGVGVAGNLLAENYLPFIRSNNGYNSALAVTTSDTVTGGTLTDGTASLTSGALSGVTNAALSGTLSVTGLSSLGLVNSSTVASTTSAADTLTATQSGQLTWIATTGAAYTLPAVTNTGATYRFIVKTAFTTNAVITSAEGDNIDGSLIVNNTIVACSGEDFITFVADGEEIGDWVEVTSDGTNWNITGSRGETAAKITCTDPS